MQKPGILWEPRSDGRVLCYACARRCLIPSKSHGFCYVRENVDGKLYLSVYGKLAAMQVDPIEKKPFNHFYPGTHVFTVGTVSCNWHCSFCQNHNISKETEVYGEDAGPEEVPAIAKEYTCEGVGFSYNEPAIFIEYVLDTSKIAHQKGLYTVFVTNGYSTPEAVKEMHGYVDAAVIDYKGSGELAFQRKQTMTVSAEPVKEAMLEYKRQGIHLEITDLIIPEVGASLDEGEKLCRWVYDNLGPDVPLQFTAFHPDYKLLNIEATPYELLYKHYEVARKAGLNYVYIGNAPGNPFEHTYCPECKKPVIERYAYIIKSWNLDAQNRCKFCGHQIPITGHRAKRFTYRDIESFYIPNPKTATAE